MEQASSQSDRGVRIASHELRNSVLESISKLDGWLDRNGWAGYDPYDIRGLAIVHGLLGAGGRFRLPRTVAAVTRHVLESYPVASRRAFGVKKRVNPKAMGLFGSAYIALWDQTRDPTYGAKAESCLSWLLENALRGYSGTCWGHPFDWYSAIYFPARTPSSTLSVTCGDAFWRSYKVLGRREHLAVCESICHFLANDLNLDRIDSERICFSYTPLDRFHVHNANLLAAEFLVRIGTELKEESFCRLGMGALSYTVNAQNEDGSFYYWALGDRDVYGIAESTLKRVDHYHTGFILRSLFSIYEVTGDRKVHDALAKAYCFYRDNLFQDRAIPKLRPDSLYPINIHSCAEAVLCMSTLSGLFPDSGEYARSSFLWTRENMQDRDGHFYYLKTPRRTDRMPYIRWGQAWMLRALAELLRRVPGDGELQ